MSYKIIHPTLYVFLGELGDGAIRIRQQAQKNHPAGGVLFLTLSNSTNMHRRIRAAKAALQQNESRLNLKRVHIYAIANANSPMDDDFVSNAGECIRTSFSEDFSSMSLTLVALLRESNDSCRESCDDRVDHSIGGNDGNDDYIRRAQSTYRFLSDLKGLSLFNCIYLLSDRNELGAVNEANVQNNYALIARLPLLNITSSCFDESLAVKSNQLKQTLFASAGFALLESPRDLIEATIRRHIMEYLIMEINTFLEDGQTNEQSAPQNETLNKANEINLPTNIISAVRSVAHRPIGLLGLGLRGYTLREAEDKFVGAGAAKFYAAHFAPALHDEDTADCGIGDWFGIMREKKELQSIMRIFAEKAEHVRRKLNLKYITPAKAGFMTQIGEAYALRNELDSLSATHAKLMRRYNELLSAIQYVRQLAQALRNICTADHDAAHTPYIEAYYGKQTDAILIQIAKIHGSEYVLQEALFSAAIPPKGGTALPDSNSLIAAANTFTRKHILPHFRLSFEADLQAQADSLPADFSILHGITATEAFYRNRLTLAEIQAAIAISLQRYDDLLYETYYSLDEDGPLAQQAREIHRHPVHFIKNADQNECFIIRLVGGFTLEELARYPVLKSIAL